jgi:hypothetical protein
MYDSQNDCLDIVDEGPGRNSTGRASAHISSDSSAASPQGWSRPRALFGEADRNAAQRRYRRRVEAGPWRSVRTLLPCYREDTGVASGARRAVDLGKE